MLYIISYMISQFNSHAFVTKTYFKEFHKNPKVCSTLEFRNSL